MLKEHKYLVFAIITTVIVLSPSLLNGWTNLDDPIYILENTLIQDFSFSGIQKMFTTFHVNGSYNPVVLFSWALDYQISGYNPLTFHISNLLLHLLTTVCVYVLTIKITKNKLVAGLSALLFSIHPMHIEAVAWVTARKDLLYTLFYFLGLIVYINFIKQNKKVKWYSLCLLLYSLSLLSKGSAITFPIILLGIDYLYKRKDTGKLMLEKIPFFILSIGFTYLSITAQEEGGALQFRAFYSVWDSLAVGFYGYLSYLIKIIFPYHLSAIQPYPTPSGEASSWYFYAAALPILLLTIFLITRMKKNRLLVFGFAFYFITLIPVIQVLSFAISVTADRFTYLPYFGVFLVISCYLEKLYRNYKKPVTVILTGFLLLFSWQSFSYATKWRNAEILWNNVLEFYPDCFFAYINRAEHRITESKYIEAEQDCKNCLKYRPNYFLAHYNLGLIYQNTGQTQKAIDHYTLAIAQNPESFESIQNRGILYSQTEQKELAHQDFTNSITLLPNNPNGYINLGILYLENNAFKKAIKQFEKAISLNSELKNNYYYIGKCYQGLNQPDLAIKNYSLVPENYSNYPKSQYKMGIVYLNSRQLQQADISFTNALRHKFINEDVYFKRGLTRLNLRQYSAAIADFNKALKLNPNNELTYLNKGITYFYAQNKNEAKIQLQKCLDINPNNPSAINYLNKLNIE